MKILDNIGWLFFDKVLRLGIGLFVGVWAARYLGPEQFGQLNYALAFVGLIGAVATLGLNGIVVRDIVRNPEDKYSILGTALGLQVIGSVIALALMVGTIVWLRPDDLLTRVMVIILGVSRIFQSSAVVSYWFESQVQSRYTVWATNSVFILFAGVKVALILRQAPLLAFVWIILFEAILSAIVLFSIYVKKERALHDWTWLTRRAKALLKDSWPLALSGIAIIVYMRIDQIMLGEMVGSEAVGVYSAALRLSEAWYMIPMIIAGSLFPNIIEAKNKCSDLYDCKVQSLLNLLAALAVGIALVVTFVGDALILLIYGSQYSAASLVLKIHIWAGVFVSVGVAGSKWYLVENLQKLNLSRAITGAFINVIVNLALIPNYGAVGAAVATVISYSFSAYLLDLSSPRSRYIFKAKTRAIFFGPFALLKNR